MKTQLDDPFVSLPALDLDQLSGTTKVQRDNWWRRFWKYLDDNPEIGQLVRGRQKAGCDPRKLGFAIHLYATHPPELLRQRKLRGRWVQKTLTAAVRVLRDLEILYRASNQTAAADRIVEEANLVRELLSRSRFAFGAKRLGTSRSWTHLVMIEGFIFEATHLRPKAREIVSLIKAGRYASNQQPDRWESNPENIRKGLKNFKENNPSESYLWTHPSTPP